MTTFADCNHSTLTLLWLCGAITLAVFAMMIYSLVSFKKSPDGEPTQFVHYAALEIGWAVIPMLIVVCATLPAVKAMVVLDASCVTSAQAPRSP